MSIPLEERGMHLLTSMMGIIALYMVVMVDIGVIIPITLLIDHVAITKMLVALLRLKRMMTWHVKDEVLQLNNENCEIEEEISYFLKEDVEEISRGITRENEQRDLVLTDWWEEVQDDDDEVIQNINSSMGGYFQVLQNFHHEEKLEQAEHNQEVELLDIATQQVEANLNSVMMETCNVQHQLVAGISFELAPNED
ncbi:hypothetical protein HAX54_039961 [Datura stramonium]|uniref:Uncharacterized protein n=1 Tax=Datura stramonium TaxID=4076 RepID=A0ABS8VNL8_DATST|nr:hypothetical protein [Datura stramonium]